MYSANSNEKDILSFWQENDVFTKSVDARPADRQFVMYDGPPFATGLPHYGHIVPSTMKDAVPRYWTMKGYRVERVWGWDCHGLPIENMIEKELNLPGKKEIEEYGIDKFNEACRSKVLEYADEWKKIVPRLGRWVDMDNAYKTMDPSFMESVWWVFKSLFERGLIYEGKRPMHVCPHCETPLSNFEVTQGYKDIKDLSVTAQFKLTTSLADLSGDVYVLAWTTTPWTLPGNVLLAVGADIEYSVVKHEGAHFIVAKDRLMDLFDGKEFEVIQQIKGSDLEGLSYEPLFPYFKDEDNAFRVVTADFVAAEDGTGIVHIAPAFGTDDYELAQAVGAPFVQHVTMSGRFTDDVTDFAGMLVKSKDDHMAADIEIVKWLAHNGKLFAKKKYEHSYPHCWRCDTPLLNYATSSWFVKVTAIKDELVANNQQIDWVPEHIKDGRFGNWLEGAKDWSISRSRFWGTPLPIWKSDDGDVLCLGSIAELEELTGQPITDLHKHKIDHLVVEKDGKQYHRIDDVLDTWFDSGSVPYARMHYPFEQKQKFEDGFPADFIAEAQDQTRGWFYTLHVLATALTSGEQPSIPKPNSPAFAHVIVNGIVLAEDGKKMSKSLRNYPDPMGLVEKYGADALRYYLLTSPVMNAENLNFAEDGVREVYNKLCNTLWNVLSFYEMFDEGNGGQVLSDESDHVLDRWILSRLNTLIGEITQAMDGYRLNDASRPIMDFVQDLSQWYVRRSRDRFKGDDEADKAAALNTLRAVLCELSKVMAPFTPFIAEALYQKTKAVDGALSVHLCDWPAVAAADDDALIHEMDAVRKVIEMGMSLRKESSIRVRQPLSSVVVFGHAYDQQMQQLIADELNVKSVDATAEMNSDWVEKEDGTLKIALNTAVSDELKKEGLAREIIRAVNQQRKEQGLTRDDRITIAYQTQDAILLAAIDAHKDDILATTLADALESGADGELQSLDGHDIVLSVTKA